MRSSGETPPPSSNKCSDLVSPASSATLSPTSVHSNTDISSSSSDSPEKKKAKLMNSSPLSQLDPELVMEETDDDDAILDAILNKAIERGTVRELPDLTPEDIINMVAEPEWQTHLKQIEESEGYEVDVFPRSASCLPVPLQGFRVVELADKAKKAIEIYNTSNNTSYEFVKVVRALRFGIACHISFKAKAQDKEVEEDFQTKWCYHYYKDDELLEIRPKPLKKEQSTPV